MYMDGRLRTGSRPSRTVISRAVYLLVAAVGISFGLKIGSCLSRLLLSARRLTSAPGPTRRALSRERLITQTASYHPWLCRSRGVCRYYSVRLRLVPSLPEPPPAAGHGPNRRA